MVTSAARRSSPGDRGSPDAYGWQAPPPSSVRLTAVRRPLESLALEATPHPAVPRRR